MESTSPKGKDLMRDGRYTLHCAVEDSSGGGGEFYVRGRGRYSDDPAVWQEAKQASPYAPQIGYIVFVFTVDFAFMNLYIEGKANPQRWQEAS